MGSASTVIPLPVIVSARSMALYTASSVASRTAWNSGETASEGRSVRARAAVSPWRVRVSGDVEKAIA